MAQNYCWGTGWAWLHIRHSDDVTTVFELVRQIRIFPDFYKSNCLYYTVLIIRDTIKYYDSVSNTLCQNLVLLGVLIAKIFQKDE